MFGHLLDDYKDYLDKNKNNEEALKKELRDVRFTYNLFKAFDLKLIVSLFGGFVIGANSFSTFNNLCLTLAAFSTVFFVILVLVCVSNIFYEKMKIVEDKLVEINNAAQSKSNKVSVRFYNRSLLCHSNFIS
ncbi:hypothetical protein ACMZ7D_02950 [Gardnerella vaginalis]|uniref:hypothetical protein n=1 Tax=Gardnerella vaginalis TaxID=2702 RepID=UPI0039EF79D7